MQVFIRLGREVEVCRPLFATFSSGVGEELWEGRSENDRGSGKRRRRRRRPLRLFNDASPRILSLYTYASSCGVSRGSGQSVLCCTHVRIVGDGGSRAVAGSSGLINKGRTRVLSFPLSRRSARFLGAANILLQLRDRRGIARYGRWEKGGAATCFWYINVIRGEDCGNRPLMLQRCL